MEVNPFFWLFLLIVVVQRLSEMLISQRNAAWMQAHGGKEFGKDHFKWVVFLMVGFFLALPLEVYFLKRQVVGYWPLLFFFFLLAQILRHWAMWSLGKCWNVRIWVVPGMPRVSRGPYRFISHPNYVAVLIELITISCMVQAYFTCVFSVLGFLCFLRVRIPEEEKALSFLK